MHARTPQPCLTALALLVTLAAMRCGAASPRPSPAPERLACTVDEAVGELFLARENARPRAVLPGEAIRGVQTLLTSPGARARLVFPGGIAVHVGPYSRVQVAPAPVAPALQRAGAAVPDPTPILLRYGSVRIDNRPGDPGGPDFVVATRPTEVHVPADGRAVLSISRRTGQVPQVVRVSALHRACHLVQSDGTPARDVAEGHQLTGAGWIPVRRWVLRVLGPGERRELEQGQLMNTEAALAAGPKSAIPDSELRLDGRAIPPDPVLYLTRADIPECGQLILTGRVLCDRLPKALGMFDVQVSRDGGDVWEKVTYLEPDGRFTYPFSPQEGVEYRIQFALTETADGRQFQATKVYPILFREKFTPTVSDLLLCQSPFPPERGPLVLYSDELEGFALTLTGTIRSDGPISRLRVFASPDAGASWKPATLTAPPMSFEGSFRVAFPPVPGATFRFRVRAEYARGSEAVEPRHPLLDWETPIEVRYSEARSVDRAKNLIEEFGRCLASLDLRQASALLASRFHRADRDLKRGQRIRLVPGRSAREAGTLQLAVRWEKEDPSGSHRSGDAIFLFVKEDDWRILDIVGDDPLVQGPLVDLRDQGEEALETVTMGLDTVFDFEARRSQAYSPKTIPRDLAFYVDDVDGPAAVLGTHDRRLAIVGRTSLNKVRALSADARLEFRSRVVPEAGTSYFLKTSTGSEVLFEVQEVGRPGRDGQPTRVKLAFLTLPPRSE